MNNDSSAPLISAALLEELLTAPRTSTEPLPPLLQELLAAPPSAPEQTDAAPPSAPKPSLLQELLTAPPSAPEPTDAAPPSAPEPTDDLPLIDIASPAHDDNSSEYELVTLSTAHPNFNPLNPEHVHEMMSDKLSPSPIDLATLPFPRLVPLSLLSHPRPLSPFPPSPQPASPSPPASPRLPEQQLPERRWTLKRLRLNTPYKIQSWRKQHFKLLNHECTQIFIVILPKKIRPTKKQKMHHLFNSNLYLRLTKINGRLQITIDK